MQRSMFVFYTVVLLLAGCINMAWAEKPKSYRSSRVQRKGMQAEMIYASGHKEKIDNLGQKTRNDLDRMNFSEIEDVYLRDNKTGIIVKHQSKGRRVSSNWLMAKRANFDAKQIQKNRITNAKNLLDIEIAAKGEGKVKFAPAQIIIGFDEKMGYTTIYDIIKSVGGEIIREMGLNKVYLIITESKDIEESIQLLISNNKVKYAHPNFKLEQQGIYPNDYVVDESIDPSHWNENSWNGSSIPEAWDLFDFDHNGSIDSSEDNVFNDVIIAIVDSGVDYTHYDLEERIWVNPDEIPGNGIDDDNNGYDDDIKGWDFDYLDDNDPMDEDGHGTQVAGIASATANNNQGMAGVAWASTIMPVRTSVWLDSRIAGITYAADNGADIINMSFGWYESGSWDVQALKDAVNYAYYQKGCILVGAAGNDGISTPMLPAGLVNVICVGGLGTSGTSRASGSNYGVGLDIMAPFYVASTIPNDDLDINNGTSFSAPFVSGVAALMRAVAPNYSNTEIRDILCDEDACDNLGPDGWDNETGWGRVNAFKALKTMMHKITPSAGSNGSIDPSVNVYVRPGGNQTFNASPNTGYVVDRWEKNGVVVQTGGNTYPLTNVTSSCSIYVAFKQQAAGSEEITLTATEHANPREGTSSSGSNSDSMWVYWDLNSDDYTYAWGLIRFNLASIPSNSVINSATLKLNCTRHDDNDGGGSDIRVRECGGSWSAGTVNWANKPASTGSTVSTSSSGLGQWQWDLKGIVQEWIDGTNNGLYINTNSNDGVTHFSSTLFTVSSSLRPKLVITYTPPSVIYHTVTASVGANGSVSPICVDVVEGGDQTFTANPNSGYKPYQWKIGSTVVQTGGETYILPNVQEPVAVSVSFSKIVQFGDSDLKAVVEAELGVTNPAEYEMLGLTSLSASRRNITSLVGLEYAANLYYLSLHNNQLANIPDFIGNLTNLCVLELQNNQLTSLPESFGNLSNLWDIGLSDNQLTSLPESFGNLNDLGYLYLSNNQLISLPESFGNLSSLNYLDLSRNQLTSLPESIGSLNSLSNLDLESNQLTSIPESIGNLTSLRYLVLPYNQLTSIPESIGNLTNLTELWVNLNQLTSIPESIVNLTSLETLSLSSNQLTSIPESIGNLSNLDSLTLSDNQLTSIPKSIGNLISLRTFTLGGEQLINVPDWIGNLSNLQILGIAGSQITSLPESIVSMNTLELFHVGHTQLNTNFYCCQIDQIQANNPLTYGFTYNPDPCPIVDWKLQQAVEDALGFGHAPTISEMATLTVLDANDLGITSVVGLEYDPNLVELDLSGNQISDLILFGLPKLKQLDVSRNPLINVDLNGLNSLDSLNIEHCEISSLSLDNLTSLDELSASGNEIVNIVLYNAPNLVDVDLSYNDIVDINSLPGLSSLINLDLRGNLLNQAAYYTYLDVLSSNNPLLETFAYDPLVVSFGDSNLKAAVEMALGVTDPTKFEMAGLTSLDANGLSIASIKGLEYAVNLTELDLSDNSILSIDAIGEFENLRMLDLSGNPLGVITRAKILPKIIANNPLTNGIYYDVNSNLMIGDNYSDSNEFSVFVSWWLSDEPNSANDWGDGSDIDQNRLVNLRDFALLANVWLGISPDPEPTVTDNIFIGSYNLGSN